MIYDVNRERRMFQDTVVQDFEKQDNKAQANQLQLLSTISLYQTLTKRQAQGKEQPLFPTENSSVSYRSTGYNDKYSTAKSNNENLSKQISDANKSEQQIVEGVIFNNIQNQMLMNAMNNEKSLNYKLKNVSSNPNPTTSLKDHHSPFSSKTIDIKAYATHVFS